MACASVARAPSRALLHLGRAAQLRGTSGGAAIGRAPMQRCPAPRPAQIRAASAAGQDGRHRPAHTRAASSARGAGASGDAAGGGLLRRLLVSGIGAAALLAVATMPQPASAAVDTSSVFGFGSSAAATVRPAILEDKVSPVLPTVSNSSFLLLLIKVRPVLLDEKVSQVASLVAAAQVAAAQPG